MRSMNKSFTPPQTETEASFPDIPEKQYHKVAEQFDVYMNQCCVSYTKGKQVLTDVSLFARPGEILGLIGGSGVENPPVYGL